MSFSAEFNQMLGSYAQARSQTFKDNEVAARFRATLPKELSNLVPHSGRYLFGGSPGQGNWADVPWVAVFDRLITDSAQRGYYVVYLVAENCSGIYLSLNQGVTTVRQQFGASTGKALVTHARDYAVLLGALVKGLKCGPIDLGAKGRLGRDYELGSICSIYYPRESWPQDEVLAADLARFLSLYRYLVENDVSLYARADVEDDEVGLKPEHLKRLRSHKRVERNRSLAALVKEKQGYRCKACKFDFISAYGPLGHEFIEAHHLTPISDLEGEVVYLDPIKDFSVLCANCHRMIHRSEVVGQVEVFQEKHLLKRWPHTE